MVSDQQCLEQVKSNIADLDEDQCIFYQERQILAVIFAVFIIIIFIPLMIYGVYNIYKFRLTVIMQKRHYGLSMAIAIGYIIQSFFLCMNIIVYGAYLRQTTIGSVFFNLAAVNSIAASYLQFFKIWVHYFDIKFNCKQLAKEWKAVINPEAADTLDNNWFFRNRQTYGSPKYLIKRSIIISLIVFIIVMTLTIITDSKSAGDRAKVNIATTINTLILMVFSGVPIIMTFYIGCKIPAFHDNFHIKQEAKYLIMLVASLYVVTIIHIGGLFIYPDGLRQAAILIWWFSASIIAFGISILVTLWALRKNRFALVNIRRESVAGSSYRLRIELESVDSNSPRYRGTATKKVPSESQPKLHTATIRLETLIKDKYGFELLHTHLSHEFSMELILSLIEMIQYKQAIYDYVFDKESSVNIDEIDQRDWDILNTLDFGEMVPRSKIVHGEVPEEYKQILGRFGNDDQCQKKIAEFKVRAYQIFRKYIIIGSKYEINIAYSIRKRFSELMNNVDLWMENDLKGSGDDNKKGLLFLFTLFDQSIDETRGLLQFSFARLKTSAAYKKYVEMNNGSP